MLPRAPQELCGDACLEGMLAHYAQDVLHLGYPVPAKMAHLWRGERLYGDAAAIAVAAASNRTKECRRVCTLLSPAAVAAAPRPPGKTVVKD